MTERRDLVPTARRLLKLASEDRKQARAALARLSVDEQVATVCEAPLSMRSAILDLVPEPEAVVPLLPPAELCFSCKHVGVHDASWLLAQATDEQIVACLDLDAWQGLAPAPAKLDLWLASLAEAGDETLLRAARAMDPELIALYLRDHIHVALKPPSDEDWEPPESAQTLEGQFYFAAKRANDDLAPLLRLVHVLFQKDYWLYFRMLQSVSEELQSETVEWALRWRTGRLEDLGFPSWDNSMRIYGHLRPERLADMPAEITVDASVEWALPVWITDLPMVAESEHSIFRAVAQQDDAARSAFFYAFIGLANRVAVADRLDLGDAETLPNTLEKAARVASLGLEHVASANDTDLSQTLRRVPLERLFRVGVGLSPEGVRPSFSEPDGDDEESEPESGGASHGAPA
ncbi:MAG: hypothetical protein JRG92_19075 [Deltaproteobacteria bacterium]|nr:hypothetical protein [Deltaproteobacteria bacterium]